MNNGVNFGANWNAFDLFNIPVTSHTYTPAQPISTPIDQIRNPLGEATSITMYIPGGWSTTQIGNGWDLFGGIGAGFAGFFRSPSAIKMADAAKNFGKSIGPDQSPIEDLWSDHTALDWEKLVSEETNTVKSLLNSYADGLDGILSGGEGLTILPMISPNAMGCAGYGNLQCGNGFATTD
jgi:hypothetical protein